MRLLFDFRRVALLGDADLSVRHGSASGREVYYSVDRGLIAQEDMRLVSVSHAGPGSRELVSVAHSLDPERGRKESVCL